jgi:hypothetical protein
MQSEPPRPELAGVRVVYVRVHHPGTECDRMRKRAHNRRPGPRNRGFVQTIVVLRELPDAGRWSGT